jgi:hypothetical protein
MTTLPTTILDENALEQLILQVRGIVGARVVLDNHGRIEEIHAIGSPERSAKQTVRDIESMLLVRGKIRVDHRKISLVQIPETRIRVTTERVRLAKITSDNDDPEPLITVELAFGEQRGIGASRVQPSIGQATELTTGLATLNAIQELTKAGGQLELVHLQRQPFGAFDVCLAHVTHTHEDTVDTMLGISVIRGDVLAAAARAVLDAVNRRLPYLLTGQ